MEFFTHYHFPLMVIGMILEKFFKSREKKFFDTSEESRNDFLFSRKSIEPMEGCDFKELLSSLGNILFWCGCGGYIFK